MIAPRRISTDLMIWEVIPIEISFNTLLNLKK